jgi:hypothetical protein
MGQISDLTFGTLKSSLSTPVHCLLSSVPVSMTGIYRSPAGTDDNPVVSSWMAEKAGQHGTSSFGNTRAGGLSILYIPEERGCVGKP